MGTQTSESSRDDYSDRERTPLRKLKGTKMVLEIVWLALRITLVIAGVFGLLQLGGV